MFVFCAILASNVAHCLNTNLIIGCSKPPGPALCLILNTVFLRRMIRANSHCRLSGMSMFNVYISRVGKHLSVQKREVLKESKDELCELYGKPRTKV
ncbi:hypothetical protein Nit79A3_2775 [Nitrosomonas sp. Is79A3]